jgi:hypothetical protein
MEIAEDKTRLAPRLGFSGTTVNPFLPPFSCQFSSADYQINYLQSYFQFSLACETSLATFFGLNYVDCNNSSGQGMFNSGVRCQFYYVIDVEYSGNG